MTTFFLPNFKSCLYAGFGLLLFFPGKSFAQNFTNVSSAAGVTVTHAENPSDIVDFSSGAAWFDFDQDQDLDLYVTMRNQANHLYRNNGNGTFSEVAIQLGAADATGDGGGVAIADFNNDGWPDIFLANADENVLLRNNNGSSFSDITNNSGLDAALNSRSTTACWGDFDDDGYLDLYVAQHIPVTGNNAPDGTQKDFLFLNNRNETFTDVSDALPLADISGYGFTASWTDFDKDGDVDILLVNDCDGSSSDPNESVRTRLFRNDQGGDPHNWIFTEVSVTSGINDCRTGRGLAIGDFNRDGWYDYFYTNTGNCVLWENAGDATFSDVTSAANITNPNNGHSAWGSSFFDYNNDGYQDIFVAMGSENSTSSADPQENLVYKNNGDNTFSEIGTSIGMDHVGKARSMVYGDYDNDGDLDVFLLNYGEACVLLRNDDNTDHHFLKVKLNGVYSNKAGIGAQIKITTPDGMSQYFETRSGSNLGGGDDINAHFGVGLNSVISSLEVKWPSGIVQNFSNIPVNEVFSITESNTKSFTDVSVTSGVDVIHDGVDFPDMSVGSGAAWFDYDKDGYLDLYMSMRTGANKLYHNNGDGTFEEVAEAMGVEDAAHNGAGVVVADINNDGWQDLYLCNGDWDILYKNVDGTSFQDITAGSGLEASGTARGNSATWGDYDQDGYLDLFISNHVPLDADDPDATNQDFLFHNNGDETFTDVSHLLSINPNLDGYGFIGGWTDFDNDGDMDILLVNDCNFSPVPGSHLVKPTKLFRNDGGTDPLTWNFTEVAAAYGINDCRNGMGLAVGDYDRDGYMDYAYSNIGPLALFKNTSGQGFENFAEQAEMGGDVSEDYWSWGMSFLDYDADGWQDVIVSMGAMSTLPTAVPHPNHLYRNKGDGTFEEVAADMNLANTSRTRNSIHGDYDNDGDLDLFVVSYGQQATLMRNDIENGNHYLKVKLIGTASNKDGIGSRLKLTLGDGSVQYFETRSGSNLGGGDAIDAYFGLGDNTAISELEVRWPSGYVQTVSGISIDDFIQVTEPALVDLQVNVRAILEGPLSSGLMNDQLRANDLIPAEEPYTTLGFNHVDGGGETIDDYAAVMGVEGSTAIVDWIFLELRSKTDPTSIVGTRSALLQRNGAIVDTDGTSSVTFPLLPEDDYYIVVRHRNHFGVRSLESFPLSAVAGSIIDFSDPTFDTFGTNAQNNVFGLQALIAGEANLDGQINAVDKNAHWRPQNGQSYQYLSSTADFNLDGAINAVDKNAYWRNNNSKTEQLD